MEGPLEGIKAVEWAAYANSPIIGVMLGDFGAEIIKIEERGVGDPTRGMKTFHGAPQVSPKGTIASYESTNRNKKSIALDLKKEKGREIAYKLIKNADIFYTNYGQTRATRVGLNYEVVSKINPGIIYSNNTGYGTRGPESERRAFDPAIQARTGMMMSCGERGTPPSLAAALIIDTTGATIATIGILAALVAKERKKVGQLVNSSLLGSAIWLQMTNIQSVLLNGIAAQRHSSVDPSHILVNVYQCSDGKWILIGEPPFDRVWGEFCKVMDIKQPEYVNLKQADLTQGNCKQELYLFLKNLFATKPRDEWIEIFRQKNATFVYDRVNEGNDICTDVQALSNNYIVDFNHPNAGPVKLVNSPIEFSKTPAKIRSVAPEFGQHTEEILLDLGYSWEDIASLQEQEVI
ncbi:MAG: CoA transferase [Dehalococcoidales bacterium]|nr:CoA transferase [Dehalococcoidales bacterium]